MVSTLEKITLFEKCPGQDYEVTQHKNDKTCARDNHQNFHDAMKSTLSMVEIKKPVRLEFKAGYGYEFEVSEIEMYTKGNRPSNVYSPQLDDWKDWLEKVYAIEKGPNNCLFVQEFKISKRMQPVPKSDFQSAVATALHEANVGVCVYVEWSDGYGYKFKISDIKHLS